MGLFADMYVARPIGSWSVFESWPKKCETFRVLTSVAGRAWLIRSLDRYSDSMPSAERYMCSSVFFAAMHDTIAPNGDMLEDVMGVVDEGSDMHWTLKIIAGEPASTAQVLTVRDFQEAGQCPELCHSIEVLIYPTKTLKSSFPLKPEPQ